MTNLPAPSGSSAMDETPVPAAEPKPPKASRRRASGLFAAFLNLLTLLFVLLSCLSALAVAAVFNGALAYIPGGSAFMAPTDLAFAQVLLTPTPPGTPAGPGLATLPPAWTPTETPTITPTPVPGTETPIASSTVGVGTYTPSPTPTVTPTATKPSPTATRTGPTPKPTSTRAVNRYTLQPGSPTYVSNYINNSGCSWFGIVGRAFGLDGNPENNLTVHLEGGGINADTVTGSGPGAIGPGSYLFPIADHPIETTDTYRIQLRQNTGTPLSAVYSIPTFGDCAKNQVMVNFVQNH